jgi:hypothetical protein
VLISLKQQSEMGAINIWLRWCLADNKSASGGCLALKKAFNGDHAVVSYLHNVRTTKEATVNQQRDHDEWISYSHWGMFPVERKSSN